MMANLTEECALKLIIGLVTAVAIVVVAVVVFVAASGDDAVESEANTESTPPPNSPAPQSPPTSGANVTASPDGDDEEETDTQDQPDVGLDNTAECLVGRWLLDSDAFFDAIFAAAAPDMQTQATFEYGGGTYSLEIQSDLSYESQRTDWEMIFITAEGTVFNTINGSETGTLAVNGDNLTWNADTSVVTIELEVELEGVRREIPFGGEQTVDTEATSGTGSYSCDGDLLTATNEGVTTTWNREGSGS